MTNYIVIYAKKRDLTINAKLKDISVNKRAITRDDTRITRNGDTRITRNGDTRIARNVVFGYPRYIQARKRNLVVRAEVNHG